MSPNYPARLQDLTPKSAHFVLGIEKFIKSLLGTENHINMEGRTWVVAFSGGVDSTSLFHILRILKSRLNYQMLAVHMNHSLRPESENEARAIDKICQETGIPCLTRKINVSALAAQKKLGLEEAGRIARYAFFREVAAEYQAFAIVTGHQIDDLAEDIMLRLLRGTGWPALGGMPAWDPARRLLRPLLLTPKQQLLGFLQSAGISWFEDLSNTQNEMLRNRLRSQVIPILLKENPNFYDSIRKIWKISNADKDFLDSQLTALSSKISKIAKGYLVPAHVLADTHISLRLRLYKHILDLLGTGQVLANNIFSLDKAWSSGQTGKKISFPQYKTAVISAEGIAFLRILPKEPSEGTTPNRLRGTLE